MNAHINYELGGSFKCDLYNKDGFVSSTDWFNNFITPTGLMMPLNYAFADCFRYLSIGSSTAQSEGTKDLSKLGETGVRIPHTVYEVTNDKTQPGQYIDWRAYATGSVAESSFCGTIIDKNGPHFYRAWRIPSGGDDIFIQNTSAGGLTISELMVSPSSGTDPIGKYAFSRVQRSLFIPNGYSTIISYQLRINLKNTGVTTFGKGTFATGDAEVLNDANLIETWANLSGYYRQVYNGLRYVDSYGATYIPKYGDCLEPSSFNMAKALWYLSPDNSQFDVSSSGGEAPSIADSYKSDGLARAITELDMTSADAYNMSSTLSYSDKQKIYNDNHPELNTNLPSPDVLPLGTPEANLRAGGPSSYSMSVPRIDNYKNVGKTINYQTKANPESEAISYATPGVLGFSSNYSDFGRKIVTSSQTVKLPIQMTGQNLITGRKKTINRKSIFAPVSSLGYNTRFGSLVFAYNSSAVVAPNRVYYPMIDCLFYDSSGRALMPHYRFITGIHLDERGTGVLNCQLYLTGGAGGNIYRYIPYTTFRGDSNNLFNHPLLSNLAWSGGENNLKYSGLNAAGNINANVSGTTGVLNNISGLGLGTFSNYTGWGAVYGTVVNSGFYDLKYDIGLADHSLVALSEPASTGQLYWKTINEAGKINLAYSGLKYYDPDLGFAFSDTGWYSSNRQVIKKIDFEAIQSGNWNIITNSLNPNFVKNVTGLQSQPNYLGYFLTTKQFSGTVVNAATDVCIGAGDYLTGYIIARTGALANGGDLKGTVYSAGIPNPQRLQFFPMISGYTLNSVPGCRRVYSLFTGLSDRGYPDGTGGFIRAGDELNVFFTGISGGTKSIYLTYISGNSATANLTGYSFLSGNVYTTNFCAPHGYPSHQETSGNAYGWKLSPNFNEPTYYGTGLPAINFGGQYPALSLDNGLEMYLTLSWQSPCGNADPTTCNEPV